MRLLCFFNSGFTLFANITSVVEKCFGIMYNECVFPLLGRVFGPRCQKCTQMYPEFFRFLHENIQHKILIKLPEMVLRLVVGCLDQERGSQDEKQTIYSSSIAKDLKFNETIFGENSCFESF